MSNEMFTQLPGVTNASLSDIICAVQGYVPNVSSGTSVQETLQQVLSLVTAGTNISVTFSGGNLVISAIGVPGIGATDVTTTSATMVADNIYTANNAGQVSLLLPATAAFGSLIYVSGKGAGGWIINQNAGQTIKVAPSSTTTTGTGGSLASTGQYDAVLILCTVANTTWTVQSMTGAGLTIV